MNKGHILLEMSLYDAIGDLAVEINSLREIIKDLKNCGLLSKLLVHFRDLTSSIIINILPMDYPTESREKSYNAS